MPSWTTLPATAALALLTAPAFAQVTADDVWANQISYLASLGLDITATQVRDGATLTMTGIAANYAVPMDLGTIIISVGDVMLTENGDGTVAISYGDESVISATAALTVDGETGAVGADFILNFDNYAILASGTPTDVTYATTADMIDIAMDGLELTGGAAEGMGDDMFSALVYFTVHDVVATTQIRQDSDLFVITSESTTGRTIYDVTINDGFEALTRTVGSVASTASTGTMQIPKVPVDLLNLSVALRNGLSLVASTRAADTQSQSVTADGEVAMSDQTQSIALNQQDIRFDAAGLTVSGNAEGIELGMAMGELIPERISVTLASAGGNMTLPLLAGADPQQVAFGMELRGLSVNDEIWDMLDPGATLPRDPATLVFGIEADVVNRVDLFDIASYERIGTEIEAGNIPVDLLAVRLTALETSGLGALLTGNGAFTFDNSDKTTFPGFPRPEGQATAQLNGAYALLDKLSQMGLIPAEGVMGARMAMGMLAQAKGADQLSSTFSIGPDGTMLVNGKPIPSFP